MFLNSSGEQIRSGSLLPLLRAPPPRHSKTALIYAWNGHIDVINYGQNTLNVRHQWEREAQLTLCILKKDEHKFTMDKSLRIYIMSVETTENTELGFTPFSFNLLNCAASTLDAILTLTNVNPHYRKSRSHVTLGVHSRMR